MKTEPTELSEERDRLGELLTDAEQRLAGVPDLQLRIADLEYELSQARAAADAARKEARRYDEQSMRAQRVLTDVMSSPSWQVTKPLRAAKRAVGTLSTLRVDGKRGA